MSDSSLKDNFDNLLATSGRALLALYFLVFGVQKIFSFESMSTFMSTSGMFMVPFFLALTIIVQVGGGAALLLGYRTKFAAFILAGLTLVISLVIHDFWTMPAGELQTGHETQNFVKNMGIMAGLLAVAGLGAGPWSLDNRKSASV